MDTLLSYQFWFSALVYLFSTFITFFLPGFLLFGRSLKNFKKVTVIPLCIALGVFMWGLQGYILGFLQLRQLTYVYVLGLLLGTYFKRSELKSFIGSARINLYRNKLLSFLILMAVVIPALQLVGSGLLGKSGVTFYRIHGFDSVMHLGFIQSINRSFPPLHPGIAGEKITNYHFWSDLVMADQVRIFHLKSEWVFFQFSPIFFASLTALGLMAFLSELHASKSVILFALFWLTFGADLLYIPMYFLHHKFGFWLPALDNGALQFLNMPHAVAKSLFFPTLLVINHWLQTKRLKFGILGMLMSGLLFGFKVYFGIYLALGLLFIFAFQFLNSLFRLLQRKISFKEFLLQVFPVFGLGIIFLIVVSLVYLPINSGAGGLTYVPLEWPRLLMDENHLDWRYLRYRLAIYEYFKRDSQIFIMSIIYAVVCLFGTYGIRLLGFIPFKKSIVLFKNGLWLLFFPPAVIFALLGLNTLQVTGGYNTFNFFAVSAATMAITTAVLCAYFWKSKFGKLIVVLLMLATLPRIAYETGTILTMYLDSSSKTVFSPEILAAGKFIETNTTKDVIVAAHPFNKLNDATPYLAYISNRNSYYSGLYILESQGKQFKTRREEFHNLFRHVTNSDDFRDKLKTMGIGILYVEKKPEQIEEIDLLKHSLSLIYENREVFIFRVE